MEIVQSKICSLENLTISGIIDCFKIFSIEGYEWFFILRKISGRTKEILGVNLCELDSKLLTDDVEIFNNLRDYIESSNIEKFNIDMPITILNLKSRNKRTLGRIKIFNNSELDNSELDNDHKENLKRQNEEGNKYLNFEIIINDDSINSPKNNEISKERNNTTVELSEKITNTMTAPTILRKHRSISFDESEDKMNHDLISLTRSSINLINELRKNESDETSVESSNSLDLIELSLKSSLDLIDRNTHRRINSNLSSISNITKVYVNLIRYVNHLKDKYSAKINLDIQSNYSCLFSDYNKIKRKLLRFVRQYSHFTIFVSLYEDNSKLICRITRSDISDFHIEDIDDPDENQSIEIDKYYISDDLISVKDINFLMNNQKPVVLFADDSLVSIKIISRFFSKILTGNNYIQQSHSGIWTDVGYMYDNVGDYLFIFVINGMYAKDIAIMTNPKMIITDIQMPKLNGLQLIKELLLYGIKSQIFINSSVSVESVSELEEIPGFSIKFIQKGSSVASVRNILNSP